MLHFLAKALFCFSRNMLNEKVWHCRSRTAASETHSMLRLVQPAGHLLKSCTHVVPTTGSCNSGTAAIDDFVFMAASMSRFDSVSSC